MRRRTPSEAPPGPGGSGRVQHVVDRRNPAHAPQAVRHRNPFSLEQRSSKGEPLSLMLAVLEWTAGHSAKHSSGCTSMTHASISRIRGFNAKARFESPLPVNPRLKADASSEALLRIRDPEDQERSAWTWVAVCLR